MEEATGDLPGLSLRLFLFEGIDQFDGGEEADTLFVVFDGLHTERGGDVVSGKGLKADIRCGVGPNDSEN